MKALLFIIGVIVLLAVVGGIVVHKLFWLLLIVGLAVFAWGALTGRITE